MENTESNSNNSRSSIDPRRKPDLTVAEKHHIAEFFLHNTKENGQIRWGAQLVAAARWKCCKKTVYYIWKAVNEQSAIGKPLDFSSKKKGNNWHRTSGLDIRRVEALSVLERTSIRKMAAKLNISKSQLGRYIKNKELRPHTNALKPMLTDANKIARLKFYLSSLVQDQTSKALQFENMHNTIHIDEKWFFITNKMDRYYLLPNEVEPYRSCKSKRFITKVMFLCAVARPLFSSEGGVLFDGKICIFPFTTQEPAKRNSKNRSKGTMETKPIQAVTKAVIEDCLLNKVIPAIKEKWPNLSNKHIVIQQDNANPHLSEDDADFMQAANTDGFTMKLMCQPSNSPDTNVNDLGFFRAIQSLQTDKAASNVEDLLENVIQSYQELSAETLNGVFLTLQCCMVQIMLQRGGNNYKIPHMNKGRQDAMGELPTSIEVDEEVVKGCLEFLQQQEISMGSQYNFECISRAMGY